MSATDYDWRADAMDVTRRCAWTDEEVQTKDYAVARLAAHIESLEADVEALVEAAKGMVPPTYGRLSRNSERLRAAIARIEGSTP